MCFCIEAQLAILNPFSRFLMSWLICCYKLTHLFPLYSSKRKWCRAVVSVHPIFFMSYSWVGVVNSDSSEAHVDYFWKKCPIMYSIKSLRILHEYSHRRACRFYKRVILRITTICFLFRKNLKDFTLLFMSFLQSIFVEYLSTNL